MSLLLKQYVHLRPDIFKVHFDSGQPLPMLNRNLIKFVSQLGRLVVMCRNNLLSQLILSLDFALCFLFFDHCVVKFKL